jgi:hypothetical protein
MILPDERMIQMAKTVAEDSWMYSVW